MSDIETSAQLLREARAGGLDKAAEIARYWAAMPMRNDAYRAACREIETSCLATAGRIRRGEYENPTSDVMQSEKTCSHKSINLEDYECNDCGETPS